jgi:hypothetical protein
VQKLLLRLVHKVMLGSFLSAALLRAPPLRHTLGPFVSSRPDTESPSLTEHSTYKLGALARGVD